MAPINAMDYTPEKENLATRPSYHEFDPCHREGKKNKSLDKLSTSTLLSHIYEIDLQLSKETRLSNTSMRALYMCGFHPHFVRLLHFSQALSWIFFAKQCFFLLFILY